MKELYKIAAKEAVNFATLNKPLTCCCKCADMKAYVTAQAKANK